MDNATRRHLLQRIKSSGFTGSIIDVFRAYDQGIDLIGQYEQMQVANTPQEQQQGLRPQHQAGNTNASMAFPNQPPNASFNTVGMKAPIDMKQYDDKGNLVMSYEKVPPGVTDLKMSSKGGTVIETPAKMQSGGLYNYDRAMELGYEPDKFGHLPSVDDQNGMWLKSSKHPTAVKELLHGYLGSDHYKTHNLITNPEGHFGEDQLQYIPKQEKYQNGGIRKYQNGGQADTLYVNTPDHPRIQQYADSSYAYNMGLQGQAKALAESQKVLDEYNNRNNFTGSHKAFGQTSSINTNTSNTIRGLQPSSTQKINYMAPAPYDPSTNVPVKIPVPGPNTFQSGIVYSLWDKPKQPVVYRREFQQMDKINPSAIPQSTPNASLKPVGKYINNTRPPQTMYKQDPSVSTGQYPIGEYLWDSNSKRWKTDTWDPEMQKASRQLAIPRGYKLGGIKRK